MVAIDHATGRKTRPTPKTADGIPVDPHIQTGLKDVSTDKPRGEQTAIVYGGTTNPSEGTPFDGLPYHTDPDGGNEQPFGTRYTDSNQVANLEERAEFEASDEALEPGEAEGQLGRAENADAAEQAQDVVIEPQGDDKPAKRTVNDNDAGKATKTEPKGK